ncbi:MAG: hypothetical protein Q8S84_01330 [bacterium]|nr:hypothetical protein [bacterium]MDP3380215.1 hypothetical protein [bacterium]
MKFIFFDFISIFLLCSIANFSFNLRTISEISAHVKLSEFLDNI